jgi:hypothetical protein
MRLTQDQYAALQAKSQVLHVKHSKHRPRPNTALIAEAAKKKSKFKNIRCEANDGTKFASRLERDYYHQLLLRWKAGEVLWFVRQPKFDLEGGVKYIADFLVVSRQISSMTFPVVVEVIDCKGFQTRENANKLKQMKARYGIDVRLVTKV